METVAELAEYAVEELDTLCANDRAALVSVLSDSIEKKLRIGAELLKMIDRELRAWQALRGTLAPSKSHGSDEELRGRVMAALDACGGVRSAAARKLGMQKNTLYYHLNRWRSQGIEIPDSPVEHPSAWNKRPQLAVLKTGATHG